MLNLIIALTLVGCTSYLGWGFNNYYKKRVRFYKELNDLINYLITNINFYKDSINKILNTFLDNYNVDTPLTKIINNYINNKIEVDDFIFKKEEISIIYNIFYHLGRSDSENEIINLRNSSIIISSIITQCEQDYNNLGKLSTKLGVLFGLALVICFI